jgi:flagellar basal-body rod protein FlgB
MIEGVTNAGSIPVLERVIQFAGARHRLLAHNVANIDTPGFRPVDVAPAAFQAALGRAVDTRRATGGDLPLTSTAEVDVRGDGVTLRPAPAGTNILFHDGNDRDPERLMQGLVENFMAFRTAAELLRSRFDLINTAIRERI